MEDVTKLLEQLAQKLGTTVEFLWGVLLKQQYADALVGISLALLFAIVAIVAYKKIPPIIKTVSDEKDWISEMSPRQFRWILYWILQSVLLLATVGTLFMGVKILYNPEYYALQEILRAL